MKCDRLRIKPDHCDRDSKHVCILPKSLHDLSKQVGDVPKSLDDFSKQVGDVAK